MPSVVETETNVGVGGFNWIVVVATVKPLVKVAWLNSLVDVCGSMSLDVAWFNSLVAVTTFKSLDVT